MNTIFHALFVFIRFPGITWRSYLLMARSCFSFRYRSSQREKPHFHHHIRQVRPTISSLIDTKTLSNLRKRKWSRSNTFFGIYLQFVSHTHFGQFEEWLFSSLNERELLNTTKSMLKQTHTFRCSFFLGNCLTGLGCNKFSSAVLLSELKIDLLGLDVRWIHLNI